MTDKEKNKPLTRGKATKLYGTSLALVSFGFASLALIVFTFRMIEQKRQNYLLMDAVHEMQTELALSHLWLEEHVNGDTDIEIQRVWTAVSRSVMLADAMLAGGVNLHGQLLSPMRDDGLRRDVEQMKDLLAIYNKEALVKFRDRQGAIADSDLDLYHRRIIATALTLDDKLEKLQTVYDIKADRLLISLVIVWSMALAAAVLGLRRKVMFRKKTEEAVARGKQEWEQTFDSVPDLIAILDKEYRIVRANRAMAEKTGFAASGIIGRKCYEVLHKTGMPVAECPHTLLMADSSEHTIEYYEKSLDTYFLVSVSPLYDPYGNVSGSVHVARDITEQKKAEEELGIYRDHLEELVKHRTSELADAVRSLHAEIASHRDTTSALAESEQKFRQLSQEFNILLDAIPDSLVLMTPDLRVKWANSSAMGILGKGGRGVIGQRCYAVWHDHDAPCDDCPVLRSFSSGIPESSQITSPDGRLWAARAYPIIDDKGRVESVMELCTDITERLSLQAEQMRANHLASIGELAAGVAHEINNPINGIINYAQILVNRAAADSREHDIAERIIKEGDRIAAIVKSLLSFARERKEEKVPVQVSQVLSDALALTEMQLRKNGIDLGVELAPDLPLVMAHAQQIQQVFLNIINNARYALNIRYPNADPGKVFLIRGSRELIEGKEFVNIVFEDHGSGMPEYMIEKVMTPFFTTKPVGSGTGLGLSISHGIIVDHHGTITIESREKEYTRVIILLPAYTAAA